ncbi:methyltransferase-like protein 27 [Spea bombifrons]|uniref:methyltransferase-like protein 27 n=1 Tax=Spea bombifrons TaxID=233779 RepID=UPI00234BDECD|nr:methyltransferase-like protein 27 [Spea bombifrons]
MDASKRDIQQVQKTIASAHKDCSLTQKMQFYNHWAHDYEEDVSILDYNAPRLAAVALASMYPSNHEEKLVLDIACGTGLVAQELQRCGFKLFHGVDGSEGMIQVAGGKKLYKELKKCMLGHEPLPSPSDYYDAVIIVGALSDGQVPSFVIPELIRVAKPGGFVCLTTRCNPSNLHYKAQLDQELSVLQNKGLWECITVQNVEKWERAISEHEAQKESDYISGVIYLYKKSEAFPCTD